jgi:tetratricopeptide (TPR) repeat protein
MSSIPLENKDRKVIPRWRDSRVRETRELESLGTFTPPSLDEHQFRARLSEWEQNQSIVTAAELITAAVVLNKPEAARNAAEYLLSSAVNLPTGLQTVAQAVCGMQSVSRGNHELLPNTNIKDLRSRLRSYPQNAVAWVDLAREYVNAGDSKRASRAMQVALSLSPNNRFVLRAAVRLHLHAGEPERAHSLLLKAESTPLDPWLIAAELAVAPIAKTGPKFAHEATRLLSSGKHAPIHLSELASSLATLELMDGNRRKARKLFGRALQSPTENTIAQADWAAIQIGSLPRDEKIVQSVPRRFEALAFQHAQRGEWGLSLDHAQEWLLDQPFSARPAVHGSFLATSVLEDFALGEKIAREGLRANQSDFILLNNRAVALAKLDRVKEAASSISRADRSVLSYGEQIIFLATSGLIQFRAGQFTAGRKLYREAIARAELESLRPLRDRALIHLALEEVQHQTPEAGEVLKEVVKVSEGVLDPLTGALLERLAEHAARFSKGNSGLEKAHAGRRSTRIRVT